MVIKKTIYKIIIFVTSLLWSLNLYGNEQTFKLKKTIPLWEQHNLINCYGIDSIWIENKKIIDPPVKANNFKLEIDFTKDVVFAVVIDPKNQNKELEGFPKFPFEIDNKYHSYVEELDTALNFINLPFAITINFKITENELEAIRVSNNDPKNFRIIVDTFNCK